MQELFGAVIATSLVLIAVFVPVAFFPGVTGQLYKQFALTIAFAIVISTFLALTLTSALSALLLRPQQQPKGWLGRISILFFTWVNRILDGMQEIYRRSLHLVTRFKMFVIGLFIASLGATAWLYLTVPTAFIPDEDQGYIMNIIQGPEGTTQEYTGKIIEEVDRKISKIPGVDSTFSLGGVGFTGNIMLSVPLAILGALLAQSMRGLANDVYCQVGLVMLIGLASKNAILIVEFANQLREQGMSIVNAATEASLARMRPILMTALSTLIGIFPLAIATGAGSASRQSIGTAVFGGMLVATFLTLFVVPVLYHFRWVKTPPFRA
jgi:multidrug efflux pump subunit AcrB